MNAPIPQGIATAFHMLAVDAIAPSNTATQARRRRRFDEAALSALTRDVQDKGVIEPILVIEDGQRLGEPGVQYEIVAGERRWRAAMAAGLSHIPAIVTNIGRDELVAFQVVENKLREAMHPLDEAEAFRELMERGLSAEAAGARIGLKRSQAYNRLKLLEMAPEVLDAVESGRLDTSKALRIAQVPGHKMQKKALKIALTADWQGKLPSERDLAEMLRTKFFVRLDAVPFDTRDAALDANRGACSECAHCSLNDPELHAELQATQGVGSVICMDKPCHDNKVQLHFARRIDQARAAGQRIIDGEQAKRWAQSGEDFTPLDHQWWQAPDEHQVDGEAPTYRQLLGALPAEKIVLIVQPRNGEPLEAISDADLNAALKAKGIEPEKREDDIPFSDEDARTAGATTERMQKEREKEEARKTLEQATRRRVLQLIHEKWKGPLKKADLLRIVDALTDIIGGAPAAVVTLYGEDEPAWEKFSEQDLVRYAVELTVGNCVDWVGNAPTPLLEVAGRLKIDAVKVRKQVKAEMDGAREKPQPPSRKAKAGKKAKK